MLPLKLPRFEQQNSGAGRQRGLTPLGTGLHWEAPDAVLAYPHSPPSPLARKACMSERPRYTGSRTRARKG